jgi:hypothetical protein
MPDDQKPDIPLLHDKTLIKPIELDDARGRWIFEPLSDITALEAVLINHMFAAIMVRWAKGDQSRFDWREYLTRDHSRPASDPTYLVSANLARHFKPVD